DGRSARAAHVATSDATGPWPTPATAPLRLEPLPTLVDLPPGTGVVPGSTRLLVGLGGAAYGPVGAPLPDGAAWLVLGGPRSGRTTALRMLAARLRASGRTVWTDPAEVPSTGAGVLVLDDVDRLAATAAAAAASCAERGVTLLATARPPRGGLPRPRTAAARPRRAAGAGRGRRAVDRAGAAAAACGPPPPGQGRARDGGRCRTGAGRPVPRGSEDGAGARGGGRGPVRRGHRRRQQQPGRDRERGGQGGADRPRGALADGADRDGRLDELPGEHRAATPAAAVPQRVDPGDQQQHEQQQHDRQRDRDRGAAPALARR